MEVDSASAAVDRMNQGGFAGGRMNVSHCLVETSLQDSEQSITDHSFLVVDQESTILRISVGLIFCSTTSCALWAEC